jgi:hypothetical protein
MTSSDIEPPFISANVTLVNEVGSTVTITAAATASNVNVTGEGPTSTVDHTWTRKEAAALLAVLSKVLHPT